MWQSRFLLPTSCTLSEHRSEFQNAEHTYNHLIIKISLFYTIVNQYSYIFCIYCEQTKFTSLASSFTCTFKIDKDLHSSDIPKFSVCKSLTCYFVFVICWLVKQLWIIRKIRNSNQHICVNQTRDVFALKYRTILLINFFASKYSLTQCVLYSSSVSVNSFSPMIIFNSNLPNISFTWLF